MAESLTSDHRQMTNDKPMFRLGGMTQMRWLRWAAVLLGLTAVLLFMLIALGLFDPQPLGQQTWTARPITLTILAADRQITWLPEPLPTDSFTVRGTIIHQSGELDSGAGLVLADEDTAVIIAISPLGYVTIQQNEPITDYRLLNTEMPWQPWPHVHTDSEPDEIWLDVADGQMRVRINRDLLWTGDLPFRPTRAGVYGESFGDTAVFDFQEITLFADTKGPGP